MTSVSNKIKTIEALREIVAAAREAGQRVVLAHGVFDLLHIGHLRYLHQAREMGDILCVTVSPDRFVDKGPNRPAFNELLRLEALASLLCVDYVALNEWPTAVETIHLVRPDVYVKGSDFKSAQSDTTGKLQDEQTACQAVGTTLAFTAEMVFSSTNLINRFFSSYPQDTQDYLRIFSTRHSLDDVRQVLSAMSGLRVLVVGDTIIDDYRYCTTLGVATKDPVLVVREEHADLFAGGVLAVANHLAGFTSDVRLFTVLGQKNRMEDFVRQNLKPNIRPAFVSQSGAPTIIKRRFLDGYGAHKLFEVYLMDASGLSAEADAAFVQAVETAMDDCDLVVVADFGHGAISAAMRAMLSRRAPYLAVNTQANAGNQGRHTIGCYCRADFASLSLPELLLETRGDRANASALAESVRQRLGAGYLTVTLGKEGSIILHKGALLTMPVLAVKVLDRIGAGDALFAVSALAARVGAPAEILGLLGNAAGALTVGVMGNQKFVERGAIDAFVTSLLK